MRTLATFRAAPEAEDYELASTDLVSCLARELPRAGFPAEMWADSEHLQYVVVYVGRRTFMLELGAIDNHPARWYCRVTSRLNALARAFGLDDGEERRLLELLDHCLQCDPNMVDVRWHTAKDWDGSVLDGADAP
jgi:hypothetical protein